jgi:hypothetical protein
MLVLVTTVSKMYIARHIKCLLFLSEFGRIVQILLGKLNFKFHGDPYSAGAELFRVDGRTDRHKAIMASLDLVNAPKRRDPSPCHTVSLA